MQPTQTQTLMGNHSLHLPKEHNQKDILYKNIESYIKRLKKRQQENKDKILTLELRKRLVKNYGLSVERIENLQTIFMYYCSHIFKTGKHMTFQRLQYEKSHLTMDRFFVFLKDFELITATIDGQVRQIIDKNELVLLFKKMSGNAKDLDFQQFISLLDRIGLIYYDYMINYNSKQRKLNEDRKKRRQNYLKNIKKRQAALQAMKKGMMPNQQNQQKLASHGDLQKNQQNLLDEQLRQNEYIQTAINSKNPKQINDKNVIMNNETNDNFITELINDKNIENPNDLVDSQLQKLNQEMKNQMLPDALCQMLVEEFIPEIKQNQGEQKQEEKEEEEQVEEEDRSYLLKLTPEQKIQYFYQLIDVDNAAAFKKKMREINLPIFQTKHKRVQSNLEPKLNIPKDESKNRKSNRNNTNTNVNQQQIDQKQRLLQFRSKLQEKKDREKQNSPHMTKDEYDRRKKTRMQDEQNNATPAKRQFSKKRKIEIVELETDLSSLSKIPFEQIHFKKFNPDKLIQSNEQDDKYLQEYSSNQHQKVQRSQKRMQASFEINDGKSQLMLDRLKKRAQQVEIRERNEQSKLNIDPGASFEHQMRKNRLVQKLLKIHKH